MTLASRSLLANGTLCLLALCLLIACSKKKRDAREAEAIFGEQMRKAQEEVTAASANCQAMMTRFKPFKALGQRIEGCLGKGTDGPYAVILEGTLDPSGYHLATIRGAAPLLSEEIVERCVKAVFRDGATSDEVKTALDLEAKSKDPMWPSITLELSRTHDGITHQSDEVACTSEASKGAPTSRPMLEIRQQPHIVGSPISMEPGYQARKKCDEHLSDALKARPTLYHYATTGLTDQDPKLDRCAPVNVAPLNEASRCLCEAMKAHHPRETPMPLTLEMTTKEGRTVKSQPKPASAPFKNRVWIARMPGKEGPAFHILRGLSTKP